jgi:hypothetical protein
MYNKLHAESFFIASGMFSSILVSIYIFWLHIAFAINSVSLLLKSINASRKSINVARPERIRQSIRKDRNSHNPMMRLHKYVIVTPIEDPGTYYCHSCD